MSVATGGILLFAALIAWRRLDPMTPRATGAAFGAGAGLGSALLIDLWCPVSYVPHLLIGHVLPIAFLAAAGAAVGREGAGRAAPLTRAERPGRRRAPRQGAGRNRRATVPASAIAASAMTTTPSSRAATSRPPPWTTRSPARTAGTPMAR